MHPRIPAAALAAIPFLTAGERIVFDPPAGTGAHKRFESELDVSVERLMQLSGPNWPRFLFDLETVHSLEARASATLEVDDRYLESRDGRPARLARTYRQLLARGRTKFLWDRGPTVLQPVDAEHELDVDPVEDATVEFDWNAATGDYDRSAAKGDRLDRALLDSLREDLDLRALLPEDGTPDAKTWTVAWPRLAPVVLPGLLGQNVAAPEGLLPWMPDDLPAAIARAFEGQFLTCTRVDTRLVGSERCAVIRVRSEPRSELALELVLMDGEISAFDLDRDWSLVLQSFAADISAELEGELVWSLDRNRFRSLKLAGELELEGNFALRLRLPDGLGAQDWNKVDAIFDLKLSGDVRWSATAD